MNDSYELVIFSISNTQPTVQPDYEFFFICMTEFMFYPCFQWTGLFEIINKETWMNVKVKNGMFLIAINEILKVQ